MAEAADASEAPGAGARQRSFVRELPFLVLVALGLALLIKTFLVQAFYIPSARWSRRCRSRTGCW
jgi:signal peptidase I